MSRERLRMRLHDILDEAVDIVLALTDEPACEARPVTDLEQRRATNALERVQQKSSGRLAKTQSIRQSLQKWRP